jgi:hypothetical protein
MGSAGGKCRQMNGAVVFKVKRGTETKQVLD